MATTKEIGTFGESAACRYLRKNGYMIHERNYRIRSGEIDIIAEKDGVLVFAEVKTRKTVKYGMPAEFVDIRKQRKIIRTAYYYLHGRQCAVRFDVIEVLYRNKTAYIHHIENAFGEG